MYSKLQKVWSRTKENCVKNKQQAMYCVLYSEGQSRLGGMWQVRVPNKSIKNLGFILCFHFSGPDSESPLEALKKKSHIVFFALFPELQTFLIIFYLFVYLICISVRPQNWKK